MDLMRQSGRLDIKGEQASSSCTNLNSEYEP